MNQGRNGLLVKSLVCINLGLVILIGHIEQAEATNHGRLRLDRNAEVSKAPTQEPISAKSSTNTRPSSVQLGFDPPELCAGHGEFNGISLTDWETGLGTWTIGTHDVVNPDTFDTPDWAVVGSLPDSRPGMAAFVANLDAGDCNDDDETGALTLDSAPIQIPAGTVVPRLTVNHWFATEFEYDGGNIKISIDGGDFNLIPSSAIELNPYSAMLISTANFNTNPLAGEDAFTGANQQQVGDWVQTSINLYGLAEAEDTIRLRFDFGVDACDGLIGWYVDEVEIYACSAELPPSNCGNSVIDPGEGEECDDGNTFIGDGCSNSCKIETGWQCTTPTAPGEVADGSFEAGANNPFWNEFSTNYESPICNELECGKGTGSSPPDGLFWAWLGGVEAYEEASVSQIVRIPSSASELQFEFEASICDSPSDYIELLIDGTQEFFIDGSSDLCGVRGYASQSVDITAYADNAPHEIEFHSESFSVNLDVSNFFIDDVKIPGSPSRCTRYVPGLDLVKQVINDDSGAARASQWTLSAAGPSGFSGSGPTVSSAKDFKTGSYDLSESDGPGGYTPSDWICIGGTQQGADTIIIGPDDLVTCTITNDDLGPLIFNDGFESN